ncbi:MAG: hypothetical protein IKP67_05345, partial [Spirochaetales bacterium]|nr:hypothetical protein [Spirochaetales bacterium]
EAAQSDEGGNYQTVEEQITDLQDQVETLVNNSINMVYGTTGDDTLASTDDNDIFVPNGADDTINSASYAKDKMILTGNIENVSYESIVGSNDLTVKYQDGSVVLKNYFDNNGNLNTMILNGVEYSIADDIAEKGYYTTINDVQYKIINGTSGNDTFVSSEAKEIFVANGGNDTHNGSSSDTSGDKIVLPCNREDISYSRNVGSAAVKVTYAEDGSVTISDCYNASSGYYTVYNGTIVTDDAEFNINDDIVLKE